MFDKDFPVNASYAEALERGKANFPSDFAEPVIIDVPFPGQDKVTSTDLGAIPVERQTLKVVLRRGEFTLQNIPALVKALESTHNRLASENIAKDAASKGPEWIAGYIVEIAQRVGSEYMYWARQLEEAQTVIGGIQNPKVKEEIEGYVSLLKEAAGAFGVTEVNYSEDKLSDWFKEVTARRNSSNENSSKVLHHLEKAKKSNFYDRDITLRKPVAKVPDWLPEVIKKKIPSVTETVDGFERFRGAVRNVIYGNIRSSLEDALVRFVMSRGTAEIIRQSDLPEAFKKLISGDLPVASEILEALKIDPKKFEIHRKRLEEMKTELSQEKDSFTAGLLTKGISTYQTEIAREIASAIYGSGYWEGQDYGYSSETILDKTANCISYAELSRTVWRQLLNEDVLGATTDGHMFAVLPLANGEMLKLDLPPRALDGVTFKKGVQRTPSISQRWLILDDFDRVRNAAIMNSIGIKKLSKFAHKEAVRLFPFDYDFLANLGSFYALQEKYDMAEKYLKESVRMMPDISYSHFRYGVLLMERGSKRWEEAERELRIALKLNIPHNRAEIKTKLADLYSQYMGKNFSEARKLYTSALKDVDRGFCDNPNSTKRYITQRIQQIPEK